MNRGHQAWALYNFREVRHAYHMIRKLGAVAFRAVGIFLLLFALLLAGDVWALSPSFCGSAVREITGILRDPGTQWMLFGNLGIYFGVFCLYRAKLGMSRGDFSARDSARALVWLTGALFIDAIVYAVQYLPSTDAVILLGGAALGQGMAVWAILDFQKRGLAAGRDFPARVLVLLVIVLVQASVLNVGSGSHVEYRGVSRRSGPWDNPNIFGLLMGVGIVLVIGEFIQSRRRQVEDADENGRSRKIGSWKSVLAFWSLLAMILLGRGLLNSYSRGAWIATLCGSGYLVLRGTECPDYRVQSPGRDRRIFWFRMHPFPLAVILSSSVVLSLWHFRRTEWRPVRRVFSVVNTADFAWRNRVAGWEGALQIAAEHPWFGAGWGRTMQMYRNYYLSPKVAEGAAIELNDYLMLSATLGIPALFCFGMYICRTFARTPGWKVNSREILDSKPQKPELEIRHIRIICHAGALVLLIGFWFDGGLLNLPTASAFWILMELGAV